MYHYVSENDLLTGHSRSVFQATSNYIILHCVSAHKALYNIAILHCDISVGNVPITEAQNGGFISDLDFSRIQY